VAFINPSIDAASRSAKVIAEVPNPNGKLRGGSFVKGSIVVATRPGVLQVVREALLNWDVEQQYRRRVRRQGRSGREASAEARRGRHDGR
jgi:multidrug efflux pump subunit AcrA (membrane-fusion protein)